MSASISVDPMNGADYFGLNPIKAKSDLNMATFLNLLVTQLQNQNPLEPMSDADFYAQIAQLGTVQGVNNMTSTLDSNQAVSLIGKTVTAVRPQSPTNVGTGATVTGLVTKMVVRNGERYLGIQDSDGGIVEVKTSAIQNVLPAVDMATVSGLIGRTVSGAYAVDSSSGTTYYPVTGLVTGAFLSNGKTMLSVTDSSGKAYNVEFDTVSEVRS